MTDSHAAPSAARFEVRATAADHFAWVRTRLALERTDHVMAAHRGGADRLRLRDSPVPRTLGRDTPSPRRLSSTRAALSGARPDLVRHPGPLRFDLAVLVVHSLSVGRTLHADRGRYQGGNANAGHCGRHCPALYRTVRLLCRAAAPDVARRM